MSEKDNIKKLIEDKGVQFRQFAIDNVEVRQEEDGEGEEKGRTLRLCHAHQAPGTEDYGQLVRPRQECAGRIAYAAAAH